MSLKHMKMLQKLKTESQNDFMMVNLNNKIKLRSIKSTEAFTGSRKYSIY